MMGHFSLEGRRVLIIGGAGPGIGGASSRALAGAGGNVAIADLDVAKAQGLANELNAAGSHCHGFGVDVRDSASIEMLVASAVDTLGGLDTLVTIVGGHSLFAPWVRVDETQGSDWDLIMQMNLGYVFRAVQSVLRVFLAQATGGTIVSIGSISGIVSSPYAAAYGAAKAGLANFAKSVALEYGRDDIRMNLVACGVIVSEAAAAVNSGALGMADAVPMGRLGLPDEVGSAVTFLASAASNYISGQTLTIDGGVASRFPLRVPNAPAYVAG
jgi:3-oxoacyl-[acyl-carrier protein] reductase